MGDDKMSDEAQRVLDALMEYDAECEFKFPMQVITGFLDKYNDGELAYLTFEADYESLTVDEEKQVIKAFLEFAY